MTLTRRAYKLALRRDALAPFRTGPFRHRAAFATVNDANATEVSGIGSMRGSKLGNIQKNTVHNNEMYGNMVGVSALRGAVSPSTAMPGWI
jgi:hypothetical protein